MIEVIAHRRDKLLRLKMFFRNFKHDLYERFVNFESIYSWIIRIPFGASLIYCGLFDLRLGYQIALVGAGAAIFINGVRNGTVNPIKYWNRVEELQKRRKSRDA